MLRLECFIGLPLTNGGPSYTCERIVAGMTSDEVRARIFTPADRRKTIQTKVPVESIVPSWARKLPYRPTRAATLRLAERRLLASCERSEGKTAAFLWGEVSSSLSAKLARSGAFIVREKYNCARGYAREILREAYAALHAAHLFPDAQYSSGAVEREMRSLEGADLIFRPSPKVAESLRACGLPEERLVATSYGFDPGRLDGTSRALGPIDGPTYLFVGSVCVRKGAHILLEAWRAAGVKGRLVLVGRMEPFIRERYADILARADVEHHPFASDVGSYFRSADNFVFPSLEEGSPLVTYEACYSGLPAIVSPMGAGPVVRDGIEGRIIESFAVEAWAEAIADAAARPDAGRVVGRAAHRRAIAFTWDKVGAARRSALSARLS